MADLNRNWRAFVEDVPWFLRPWEQASVGDTAPAGSWRPASPAFTRLFPALTELLQLAETNAIEVGRKRYLLFTWRLASGSRAWLCPRPSRRPPSGIFGAHAKLLQSFGGIVERAREPRGSWLLNQNDVLTTREARHDASFVEDYAELFGDRGIPIRPSEYYCVAIEANGNTTICHRDTGAILLFAPDHAFRHVKALPGCPRYTLYTLDGAPRFEDWVETLAKQWRSSLGGKG